MIGHFGGPNLKDQCRTVTELTPTAIRTASEKWLLLGIWGAFAAGERVFWINLRVPLTDSVKVPKAVARVALDHFMAISDIHLSDCGRFGL